jgi:hypothetical protein
MFSQQVMEALSSLDKVVDLRDYPRDLENMTNTNWRNEQKKSSLRSKRTFEVVQSHTARGLGAEKVIQSTGLFKEVSEIVEDGNTLTLAQRKKDVSCEGKMIEIKSMPSTYTYWNLSVDQRNSVEKAAHYTSAILVVEYDETDDPLVFRYRPKFLVDSRGIMRYIVESNYNNKYPYYFNHHLATRDNKCIQLRSLSQ